MLPLCLLQSSLNFKTSLKTEVNSIRNSPDDNFKWYHSSPICRKIPCERNVCHSYHGGVQRLGQQTWCLGSHTEDPQHPAHSWGAPWLGPLSFGASTKFNFQMFAIPPSQFCSWRGQRHHADKELWVLNRPALPSLPSPQHSPAYWSAPGFPATWNVSEVRIPLWYVSD